MDKIALLNEVWLGGLPPALFVAAYVWGLLGIIVGRGYDAMTREPNKTGSPVNFSWTYWIRDNAKRFGWNLLFLLIAIRFAPEILGAQITVYASFLIGIGIDKVPDMLKKNSRN